MQYGFFAVLEAFLHPGSCYHTYVTQDGENISPLPSPAMSANCFKGKHGLSKETIKDLFLRSACFSKTHWKLFQLCCIRFCLQDIIINYILDFNQFIQLSCFILSLFFYLFPTCSVTMCYPLRQGSFVGKDTNNYVQHCTRE